MAESKNIEKIKITPSEKFRLTPDEIVARIRRQLSREVSASAFREKREKWVKEDFSLIDEIKKLKKPLIEVGGPTTQGFDLVDFEKLDKKIFISNIAPGCPYYSGGELLGYIGKVDFRADAEHLPFKDKALGGLFASCLSAQIREMTIKEAKRVLDEGGIFVWQGGVDEDVKLAKSLGFEAMEYSRSYNEDGEYWVWNVIFQKLKKEKPPM